MSILRVDSGEAVTEDFNLVFEPNPPAIWNPGGLLVTQPQMSHAKVDGKAILVQVLTFTKQGCTTNDGMVGNGNGNISPDPGQSITASGLKILVLSDSGICNGNLRTVPPAPPRTCPCQCNVRFQGDQ